MCNRWLHEDRVLGCVIDEQGKDDMSPLHLATKKMFCWFLVVVFSVVEAFFYCI